MRQGFLRNVSALGVRQVLSKLLVLVWMGVLSRYLGVSQFGNFVLLMSIHLLFASLLDLGSATTFVRRVVTAPGELGRCLSTLVGFRLTTGLLGATVFALFVPSAVSPELHGCVLVLAVSLLLTPLAGLGDGVFGALEDLRVVSVANVCSTLATVSLGSTLLWLGWGLQGAVWAQLAGVVALGCVYLGFYRSRRVRPGGLPDRGFVRRFVWEALRIGTPGALGMAYGRVDRLLLARYQGASSAGMFHSATMLVNPLTDLYWATIPAALFPALTRVHGESQADFRKLVGHTLALLQGFVLPGVVALALHAGHFLTLAFGPSFAAAGPSLTLLLLGMPFVLTTHVLGSTLVIQRRSTVCAAVSFGVMAVSLGLNLAMIPRLGTSAAALTLLLVQVGAACVYVWLVGAARADYLPWRVYPVTAAAVALVVASSKGMTLTGAPWWLAFAVGAASGFGLQFLALTRAGEPRKFLDAVARGQAANPVAVPDGAPDAPYA